jgi:hypothetical protein
MQPAPPAPVDREIHGALQSVEQRQGGWYRFSILEPGKQYPVKADTKDVQVVQQAMALMGQNVSAAVRETQSTAINPHNNQPYTNRWLNAIAAYGTALGVTPTPQAAPLPQTAPMQPLPPQPAPLTAASPAQQAAPMPALPQPGLSGTDRDIAIMRQTASKVVAEMLVAGAIPEDQRSPAGLVQACEVWMAYYVQGPLRFGVQPFSQNAPQAAPAAPGVAHPVQTYSGDPGPQDGQVDSLAAVDDSIPF